jgi:hypothetical protein
MSIRSHAFGRVTLTGQDARKFKNQVAYGKPSAAAKASVRSGVKLSRLYEKTGRLSVRVKFQST